MAIIKMRKFTLVGFEDERKHILEMLHKLGCVQIEDMDPLEYSAGIIKYDNEKRIAQIDVFLSDLTKAMTECARFDKRTKGLFKPKKQMSEKEFEKHVNRESEIFDVVKGINETVIKKNELQEEQNRLNNLKDQLLPWENLDIGLDFAGTQYTYACMGTVPISFSLDSLKSELDLEYPETVLTLVSSDSSFNYIYVITYAKESQDALKLLRKYNFSQTEFKNLHQTAQAAIEKTVDRIEHINKQRDQLEKGLKEYSSHLEDIELLYDSMLIEKQKLQAASMLLKTDMTFVISGWLPERNSSDVSSKITKQAGAYIDIREPKHDEKFPILIENGPLVKPFELITELFSLPNHREFDVNPFMAPFYFLFFGLMLGDAGYGFVLALISGIVLFKFKISGTAKKLISMVFFGGISSFLWGLLFGSWFGDIARQVSGGRFTIGPIWFDPLGDPMKLLLWSCIFGVIQLYTGMALAGYKLWRDGKKMDAIVDVGLRYMYYSGIIMLLASIPGAFYITIIGAGGMVLTQGRHKKGLGKITSGILSLYDFVGFMSDVLSYSRLLALGLATAVVASVINTMGMLFGFNVFGVIVFVLVFLGGHLFNIAISTLGAYVHSSRLQYVEFFSKFYEGGGKPYKPFKYDTKYIEIANGGVDDGILD